MPKKLTAEEAEAMAGAATAAGHGSMIPGAMRALEHVAETKAEDVEDSPSDQ